MILSFLLFSLTWTAKTDALSAVAYPSWGVIYDASGNGYLNIVTGALDAFGTLTNVHQRYDVFSDSWINREPYFKAQYDGAGAVAPYNGTDMFFVFGGYDGDYTGTARRYDPSSNSWSVITSISPAREGTRGIGYPDGNIYLFGGDYFDWGLFEYVTLNDARSYDPNTDTYNTGVADMPTARTEPGVAIGTNENGDTVIYVIGGMYIGPFGSLNPQAVCEEYNPNTNTWRTRNSMTFARSGLVAVTLDDTLIYAIGGTQDGSTSLSAVEVYNTRQNTWTTTTSLPSPRDGSAGGSFVFPPSIFNLLSPPDGSTVPTLTPTLDWQDSNAPHKIIITVGAEGQTPMNTTYEGDDNIFRSVTYTLKYWIKNAGAGDTVIVPNLMVSEYTTPTLISDTIYYWTAFALNEKGAEVATPDTWWFRTPESQGIEEVFIVASVKEEGIYLRWRGGNLPYILTRTPIGTTFPETLNQDRFIDREVEPGKTYTYTIFHKHNRLASTQVRFPYSDRLKVIPISKNTFKIEFPLQRKESLSLFLYNISGQPVYKQLILPTKIFQVPEFLPSGTYFMNLKTSSLSTTKKIIFVR